MTETAPAGEDPRERAAQLREMLTGVAQRARAEIAASDPKGQALFETTAEVCLGLATAFEHYERRSEPAWR